MSKYIFTRFVIILQSCCNLCHIGCHCSLQLKLRRLYLKLLFVSNVCVPSCVVSETVVITGNELWKTAIKIIVDELRCHCIVLVWIDTLMSVEYTTQALATSRPHNASWSVWHPRLHLPLTTGVPDLDWPCRAGRAPSGRLDASQGNLPDAPQNSFGRRLPRRFRRRE